MLVTSGFLTGPVGRGIGGLTEDVLAVKERMRDLGLYQVRELGLGDDIDRGFDNAVRKFQDDNGLLVDGVLEPGGETERNLIAHGTGQGFEPAPDPSRLVLGGAVGADSDNDTADVSLVKRAFASAQSAKDKLQWAQVLSVLGDSIGLETIIAALTQDKGALAEESADAGSETTFSL